MDQQKSLLNILSMGDARNHFRRTMDTDAEAVINVHTKDSQMLKFKEVDLSAYMCFPIRTNNHNKETVNRHSF